MSIQELRSEQQSIIRRIRQNENAAVLARARAQSARLELTTINHKVQLALRSRIRQNNPHQVYV